MDVRHRGLAVEVDHHRAVGTERDAGRLEAQAGRVGQATEGPQHRVGIQHPAAVERDGQAVATGFDRRQRCTGHERDALHFELRLQVLAHLVVEATQYALATQHDGHVGAEAPQQAGELERDVAGTLHHHAARLLGPIEQIVRTRGELATGDRGHHLRHGTGGDQDLPRTKTLAAAHQRHRVRVFEHGTVGMQRNAGTQQRRAVHTLQPSDLGMDAAHQLGPGEPRRREQVPAEPGALGEALRKARGQHHQLLRHAATDHAGAADAVLFGQRDARTVLRRHPRGAHTARATADDEEIDFLHHKPRSALCDSMTGS